MNVDWCWIRQRPHILAQLLDPLYDLTVLYPKYLTRPWRRQKKTTKTQICNGIFQVPFSDRVRAFAKIERMITKRAFDHVDDYNMIWLSTPLYIDYVPDEYKGLIIYDDMDDIVNIQTSLSLAKRLEQAQDKLWLRCNLVLVSSQYLLDHLPIEVQDKALLIRNGAFCGQLRPVLKAQPFKNNYSLGYIGTISEWFDFSLIQSCLKAYPALQVELYGPSITGVPQLPGLHKHGIVEHEKLFETLHEIDCFIMPFMVNNVTLAVDPVKLYEYISFGKCIISIYYAEIDRFSPFVYFYETESQFLELLKDLINRGFPPKYDSNMQKDFILQNSWEQRISDVHEALLKLWEKKEGEFQ